MLEMDITAHILCVIETGESARFVEVQEDEILKILNN